MEASSARTSPFDNLGDDPWQKEGADPWAIGMERLRKADKEKAETDALREEAEATWAAMHPAPAPVEEEDISALTPRTQNRKLMQRVMQEGQRQQVALTANMNKLTEHVLTVQKQAGNVAGYGPAGMQFTAARKLDAKKALSFITANSKHKLFNEQIQWEIDIGEVGIALDTEIHFKNFRANVQGRAKVIVEAELIKLPCKELYERIIGGHPNDPDIKQGWKMLYECFFKDVRERGIDGQK